MSNPVRPRHPVTVTRLPLVRCVVCRRTLAYRPGQVGVVLTDHFEKAHPEMLGMPDIGRPELVNAAILEVRR